MRSSTTGSQGISLKHLFPSGQIFGAEDVYIQSCCGSWDECQQDDLFVAIVGAENDGHESAELAVSRGATAILTERLLAVDVPQCIVADSRNAFARVCQTLAGNPSQYLKMIGISGSDGKTTVSHLLQSILVSAGQDVAVTSSLRTSGRAQANKKSWNNSSQLTPPDLANWLCNSTLEGCSHAIIEASSLQLANHHLSGVQLDAAVITNIRKDNLNLHNSETNYRQANLRLLDYLNSSGFACINIDDPVSHNIVSDISSPVITFGIKQQAEVTATPLEECPTEQTFLITAGNESVPVRTETVGRSHIYNCLAAAATALAAGLELPTIVRGLENLRRVNGRMDRVECCQGYSVFVDLANSPRRLASTLSTLKRLTAGKVFCVAATGEYSHEQRREIGQIMEKSCHVPVISSPQTQPSQSLELAHQILDGFENPQKAQVIPNRVSAIEWALGQARPGDCVVVSGFGDQPVFSLDDGRWHLNDREICQAWLYDQPISPVADKHDRRRIFRLDDFRC